MTAMIPQDNPIYIDISAVEDLNDDGLPEVYLAGANGWNYCVYYYLDGNMCSVEDLTPWTWTSGLCYTTDGTLVMYAFSHTTGTAGILQYRIYEWTSSGYCMTEDLWRLPIEWDENGEPVGFEYISSEKSMDPFQDEEYSDMLITKETYERKIENLGEMTSVFEDGDTWSQEWWNQHDNADEIYRAIQEEILSWQ